MLFCCTRAGVNGCIATTEVELELIRTLCALDEEEIVGSVEVELDAAGCGDESDEVCDG